MIYDLTHFGVIFQALRKSNKYSYQSLSEASGIAKNTLRNIERGKVIPNIETLSTLSGFLKVDLTMLFLQSKSDKYRRYEHIKEAFEKMVAEHKVDRLNTYMKETEDLLTIQPISDEDIQLYQNLSQLYYRMIGHYETYINRDDNAALKAFLQGLRTTQPDFKLDQYQACMLNYNELHLFFNIVQMLDRKVKAPLHMEMYHYIFESYNQLVEKEIYLFPTLVNNMAVDYIYLEAYEEGLKFANIGINFCKEEQTTIDLPALLLAKGVIYEKTGNPNGQKYMGLSFDLLKLYGRWDIIDYAKKDLEEKLGIKYIE